MGIRLCQYLSVSLSPLALSLSLFFHLPLPLFFHLSMPRCLSILAFIASLPHSFPALLALCIPPLSLAVHPHITVMRTSVPRILRNASSGTAWSLVRATCSQGADRFLAASPTFRICGSRDISMLRISVHVVIEESLPDPIGMWAPVCQQSTRQWITARMAWESRRT